MKSKVKSLKGFEQHGVVFFKDEESQAEGSCPFCGKEKHFFVNPKSLLWDCKVCGRSGNFPQFLAKCSERYIQNLSGDSDAAKFLAQNRNLRRQTFRAWQVGWNPVEKFYSIPMGGGAITDVHRLDSRTFRSRSTTGGKISLIFPQKTSNTSRVWVCEGEWDGMALWECLRGAETVYAAPGAMSFPKSGFELCQDKKVWLLYDNDAAGTRGMAKVVKLLSGTATQVKCLRWPSDYPEGYDIRDLYFDMGKDQTKMLAFLEKHCVGSDEPIKTTVGGVEIESNVAHEYSGEGMSYEQVVKEYQKWLHLPNPEMLEVMFGSILANRLPGDPLWMFLVAPPGGSKSELLMSLAEFPQVYSITSITPHTLISGANFSRGGDPSLIPRLHNKVMVVKDFTAILDMNQLARDEILSILRDAYDGEVAKEFGNGIRRRYASRFGILAGVTSKIEKTAQMSAALGERFLKYRLPILRGGDVVMRALQNVAKENTMRSDLREVACAALDRNISEADIPVMDDAFFRKIQGLAEWVAKLRGVVEREKYSQMLNIHYKPMAEVGTRLAKQFCRLAIGIAMFKKEKHISNSTYKTVTKTARDTAPDLVEEIVRQIYSQGQRREVTTDEIAEWTRFPIGTVLYRLQDLDLLNVVQRGQARGTWRLSGTISKTMRSLEIYDDDKRWNEGRKKHGGKRE